MVAALASQLNQLKSDYREEQKANSELAHKLTAEQVLMKDGATYQ